MRILMISTDEKILEAGSEVRQRMIAYGRASEEIIILLVSKRRFFLTFLTDRLSEQVILYPRHFLRAWFFRPPRAIDFVTAQDPFESGLLGLWLAYCLKVPLELQIHTDLFSPYFSRESLQNHLRLRLAEKLLPKAAGVRVVSDRIRRSLLERLQIPLERITVRPVLVDAEKIKKAPIVTDLHRKYPDYTKIILMASRLTKEKNIPLALRALTQVVKVLPKTLLLVVGEGPEAGRLKRQVETSGLEGNVKFESWTEDLSSYYKTANIFLLTSNYEGYGRTAVEALAAGRPVVMTDVGLAGEVVKNGENGMIVPVGEEKTLAAALTSCLK